MKRSGSDRNVIIDNIRLDGETFQTEADDVFSTGTWLPSDGIVAGYRTSETLHANGYFQFAALSQETGFVGLSASQFTVDEDAGAVQFSLTRYEGNSGPATVLFQTVSGTAEAGSDFIDIPDGRIEFADGQITAIGSIPLVDDLDLEAVESFSVSLFRAEGVQLGVPRTATVTIVDDEAGRDLIANWRLDALSLASPVRDSSSNQNDGSFEN